MNEWVLAATILIAAMGACLAVCIRANEVSALAAVEVASTLLATVLMLLSEGFHRQPFVDLALTFAFVSVVGALVFARMMEQNI
jgi:multisubunit Na+/H+ antiporter MnhF subunit